MKIEYKEYDISSVFAYFIKGFSPKEKEEIWKGESNYDPRTGKVIFRLYITENEQK